ncbi:MAG: cob(I)yrinic acid a,c-diamide adenosyltransferase [Acidimicrobiia bacterium]|nr:cob(I)yrinic acid a,c-diamide adenosyltransferase [Acidimicrobiia bacterium]
MARETKVYTKRGDDGTTGLFFGGRTAKDGDRPTAYGTVDEAQAAIGVARAHTDDPDLDALLVATQRDLYVAMAELATLPENHTKLEDGVSRLTTSMVDRIEDEIDRVMTMVELPTEFVIPGGNAISAYLDVARTVVRRAERLSLSLATDESVVIPYLNRLSDFLWALARLTEGELTVASTRKA